MGKRALEEGLILPMGLKFTARSQYWSLPTASHPGLEVKLDLQNLGQACLILFRKESSCDMRGLMRLEIEKEGVGIDYHGK